VGGRGGGGSKQSRVVPNIEKGHVVPNIALLQSIACLVWCVWVPQSFFTVHVVNVYTCMEGDLDLDDLDLERCLRILSGSPSRSWWTILVGSCAHASWNGGA
jgi:DNA-binding XRE family transcriptional regulator